MGRVKRREPRWYFSVIAERLQPAPLSHYSHDNRFRTYDPQIGRYISADPIGQFGMLSRTAIASGIPDANLYRYALGNPVLFIDPTGQFSREFVRDVLENGVVFSAGGGTGLAGFVSGRVRVCRDEHGTFSGLSGSLSVSGGAGLGLKATIKPGTTLVLHSSASGGQSSGTGSRLVVTGTAAYYAGVSASHARERGTTTSAVTNEVGGVIGGGLFGFIGGQLDLLSGSVGSGCGCE
jgi:RHS repeat-associated protein